MRRVVSLNASANSRVFATATDGLLFPASPVILKDKIFVTNLALPLTPAVGDEPEEDVTRWTVSRVKVPSP
jgi:hypothetical protein